MPATKKSKVKIKQLGLLRPRSKKQNVLLLLAGVMAVAVAGLVIVRFSRAAACDYTRCWSPYDLSGASSGSVVSKSNGMLYWDAQKDSDHRVFVVDSVGERRSYCVKNNGAGFITISVYFSGVFAFSQTFVAQKDACIDVGAIKGTRSIHIYGGSGGSKSYPQVYTITSWTGA